MNIILIGYMGSGKSSLGKLLSQKLKMNFIDSDSEIEKEEGITIPQIFAAKGEAHFRELEVEFLLHNEFENCVIATGGGMPCFHNNIDRINLIGKSVYLEVSPEELLKRIHQDANERPLLDNSKTIEFITEHLASREQYYKQTALVIDASQSIDEIVNEVVRIIVPSQ